MAKIDLICGDCLIEIPKLIDKGIVVDSIVTDPPYHLISTVKRFSKQDSAPPVDGSHYKRLVKGFMGQTWDGGDVAFRPETWSVFMEILQPGGFLLVFGGTRTFHRVACAIEDAGFILQDTIMWMYGCLSEDTQLVTKSGIRPYHKAIVGDLVLCYDASTSSYSWQPVEELYEYSIEDTVFRIQSDNTDQIVTRNHRCLVERHGVEIFELAETVARQCEARVPILENLPDLLQALSSSNGCAGESEFNLFTNLQRVMDKPEQKREDSCSEGYPLRDVWGIGTSAHVAQKPIGSDLLQFILPFEEFCSQIKRGCLQRSIGVDGRVQSFFQGENVWGKQSGMERGSNLSWAEREFCFGEVRTVPVGVYRDGAQGWLCNGAPVGGGPGDWTYSYQGRISTPRQPQSTGQLARQFDVVCDQSGPQIIRRWRGHKTDLARITREYYKGKVWCIKVPTGSFVAVRNGKVFPTGNSGFPKRKDALKPAWEPITIAYKPGGARTLQVEECRIGNESTKKYSLAKRVFTGRSKSLKAGVFGSDSGRWPANVCHDGSDEVEKEFAKYGNRGGGDGASKYITKIGLPGLTRSGAVVGTYADHGSISRFFYSAKAPTSERAGSKHPTIKPVELMKWLVPLVTPKGGTVLDPFAGSGTTGLAAIATGRNAILVEKEEQYLEDVRKRTKKTTGFFYDSYISEDI